MILFGLDEIFVKRSAYTYGCYFLNTSNQKVTDYLFNFSNYSLKLYLTYILSYIVICLNSFFNGLQFLTLSVVMKKAHEALDFQ